MLHGIFYLILNMSITAAIIVVLLLVMRAVFGRWIKKSAVFALWWIVIFRLIVPVSIPSRFSLMNIIDGYITKNVAVPSGPGILPNVTIVNSIKEASQYFPMEYKSVNMEHIFSVAGWIWLIVAVLLIMAFIIMLNIAGIRLKGASRVANDSLTGEISKTLSIRGRVGLYESKAVDTPVLLGIINKSIIVPENIPEDAAEYTLKHELCHIKRNDNLSRVIFILSCCIHWFNPFAWLLLYLALRDMEIACDERAMKAMDDSERKAYANALVSLSARQNGILTAFGSSGVRMRVINIIYGRRISLAMAAASGLFCIILAVLLLTNPI